MKKVDYTKKLAELRQSIHTDPLGVARKRAYHALSKSHAYSYTATTHAVLAQWHIAESMYSDERNDYISIAYIALIDAIQAVDAGTASVTITETEDGKKVRKAYDCTTDELRYRYIARSADQAVRKAWTAEKARGAVGEVVGYTEDEDGNRKRVTSHGDYTTLDSVEALSRPAEDTTELEILAESAIEKMPKRRRQIWKYFLAGYSYVYIEDLTGLQQKSISAEIARARADAKRWIF